MSKYETCFIYYTLMDKVEKNCLQFPPLHTFDVIHALQEAAVELLFDCAALNAAVDEIAAALADEVDSLLLYIDVTEHLLNGGQSLAAYDAILIDVNQDGACYAVLILALGFKGVAEFIQLVKHGLEILGGTPDAAVESEVGNGEGEMQTAVVLVAAEFFPEEGLDDF